MTERPFIGAEASRVCVVDVDDGAGFYRRVVGYAVWLAGVAACEMVVVDFIDAIPGPYALNSAGGFVKHMFMSSGVLDAVDRVEHAAAVSECLGYGG